MGLFGVLHEVIDDTVVHALVVDKPNLAVRSPLRLVGQREMGL
jgi:hypothetical protein